MKSINNQKGSAMLWTVLLTVIVTILLGSVMTATAAYFDYTMYTVKRQQAYFTARSATNIVVDQFANVKQTSNADGSLTEGTPSLLPGYGERVKIKNFNLPPEMGKAEATISRNKEYDDDKDVVEIAVTATYADEEYILKTKIVEQPLYFAGIALNKLTLNGNTLTLGKGTDLYWNNESLFNPSGKLNIAGNLVTKGDAIIPAGSNVANHSFSSDTAFGTNSPKRLMRTIWSSTEYIMSNKTLKVVDDALANKHSGSLVNALNTNNEYCNNTRGAMNNRFGFYSPMDGEIMQQVLKFVGLDNYYADLKKNRMSLESTNNDALTMHYVNLMSLSNEVLDRIAQQRAEGNLNWLEEKLAKWVEEYMYKTGLTVYDVYYIESVSKNVNTRDDDVIPVIFIDVDGGHTSGLSLRIKYGKDPGKASNIFKFTDNVGNMVTGFIDNIFKRKNNMSYVIINLDNNSTVELGCPIGDLAADAGFKAKKENLVFAYSIYGGPGTKVILNNNVTVVGEIYCDELILNGNAQVIYSNSSGSQIAKQKIAEIWTPIGYSKGAQLDESEVA